MSDPAAQDGSLPLTREQAILIASRTFVAYLLFWVITDLSYVPHELLSVAHYMKATGSVLGTNTSMPVSSYTLRFYALQLLENLLHIALWLMAANWFYRCGPGISNFFFPNQPTETLSPPAHPTES